MDENKSKALQAALAQIEKQFGKGSIMKMGEGLAIDDIQTVSTGSLGLDIALGIGGLPRGRVVEIYGPESSRPRCACTSWRRSRKPAASRPTSTPKTRSIPATRPNSA
jgi:recombination protein RecA